jgi:hypothetical protein
MATPNPGMSHEITLYEEEIADVSLRTFYVFDKENSRTLRRGVQLAGWGGCGGCGYYPSPYYGYGETADSNEPELWILPSPLGRYENPTKGTVIIGTGIGTEIREARQP